MIGLRKRPVTVIAMTAMTVFILFLAAQQIKRYVQFNDLRYWASRIEQGQPISADTIAAFAPKVTALVNERECQARFVKAGLTIALLSIDNVSPDLDYDAWSAALQRAEEFTRHALSCLPTNGNFWLRLAMVKQAIAEQPDETARYLILSQLYSPAEEAVLRGRYILYNKLTQDTLQLLSEPLRQDLQIICSPIMGVRRRAGLPVPGVRLAPVIVQIVPNCPTIGK